jgi:pilus assembly protein CpaE
MHPSKTRLIVVSPSPADIVALLSRLGFSAATAPALPPIVQDAGQHAQAPDVVVVDLRHESAIPPAVAELARRPQAPGIVIVAASLAPAMMLEAMRVGAKGFVAAPLSPEPFEEAIRGVLGPRATTTGQVLAFVGAKGGVGTTTLAVNVATALARASRGDALLIDLNARYGDAAAWLGLEPRFGVADALENAHRLDEPFMRGLVVQAAADLDVLAASDRPAAASPDFSRLRTLLDFVTRQYRHVVLDVTRTDAAILDSLGAAARIVVVLSQELTAIRGAARLLATLRPKYAADRIMLVLGRQDRDAEIQLDDLQQTLGSSVRVFPNDYRVALESLNRGRPLVLDNHSRLAAEINRFVTDLTGSGAAAPAKPHRAARLPRWLGGGQA